MQKIGLRPIQREGIDYEFDLGFSMDMTNTATVTKTHSRLFPSGMEIPQPGKETAERILQWLSQAPPQPQRAAPNPCFRTKMKIRLSSRFASGSALARYDRERMGLPSIASKPLEQSFRSWLCAG